MENIYIQRDTERRRESERRVRERESETREGR